ncbi:hypothetical protein cand_016380 [Cryptosporidium andersoni]|uniref:Uncharacterized protein n=1 Tax=Cryptosporidium andersoni TaxID=117008 RepID=A0A1J4MTI1_9CRYT|nr:hypothetical protein cand_016380 [Cryptosporidium andersoni]
MIKPQWSLIVYSFLFLLCTDLFIHIHCLEFDTIEVKSENGKVETLFVLIIPSSNDKYSTSSKNNVPILYASDFVHKKSTSVPKSYLPRTKLGTTEFTKTSVITSSPTELLEDRNRTVSELIKQFDNSHIDQNLEKLQNEVPTVSEDLVEKESMQYRPIKLINLDDDYDSITESSEDTVEQVSQDDIEKKEINSVVSDMSAFKVGDSEHQTTMTNTTIISKNIPDVEWSNIKTILQTTTLSTPYPPITQESKGSCINFSDISIIFGTEKDTFQTAVMKCGRSSLGKYTGTKKCIMKRTFTKNNLVLSELCSTCYAESVLCGSNNCKGPCFSTTCNKKCQECHKEKCSQALINCTGASWLPLPCGLDPFKPIPDKWSIKDPK